MLADGLGFDSGVIPGILEKTITVTNTNDSGSGSLRNTIAPSVTTNFITGSNANDSIGSFRDETIATNFAVTDLQNESTESEGQDSLIGGYSEPSRGKTEQFNGFPGLSISENNTLQVTSTREGYSDDNNSLESEYRASLYGGSGEDFFNARSDSSSPLPLLATNQSPGLTDTITDQLFSSQTGTSAGTYMPVAAETVDSWSLYQFNGFPGLSIFGDSSSGNSDSKFHKLLVGTNQDDSIDGEGGNDILWGLDGSDKLEGKGGNDDLYGGNGDDNLYGDNGDDNLYGGNGSDRLYGSIDNDGLYGGNNNDGLWGGDGNDKLDGQAGNDYLVGGEGNDLLIGGIGKDELEGFSNGPEFDTLTGGTEADKFLLGNASQVYYLNHDHATITDFSLLEADKIQIKGKFEDGYSLKLVTGGGAPTQDTYIYFQGNLIGIIQDQNITNVSPHQVFIPAPYVYPQ